MRLTLCWVFSGKSKHLWGQDLVTLLWLLRKMWDIPNICSFFLCNRSDLGRERAFSEDSWLRATGAMCNGWHMVLGIMQTHGWPEARYSTEHYWVRPELPTDSPPHRPFNLYLQGRISWAFLLSGQQPATLFMSCTHRAYGSCAVQAGLLPTQQGVGGGMLLEPSLNRGWEWGTDCQTQYMQNIKCWKKKKIKLLCLFIYGCDVIWWPHSIQSRNLRWKTNWTCMIILYWLLLYNLAYCSILIPNMTQHFMYNLNKPMKLTNWINVDSLIQNIFVFQVDTGD